MAALALPRLSVGPSVRHGFAAVLLACFAGAWAEPAQITQGSLRPNGNLETRP